MQNISDRAFDRIISVDRELRLVCNYIMRTKPFSKKKAHKFRVVINCSGWPESFSGNSFQIPSSRINRLPFMQRQRPVPKINSVQTVVLNSGSRVANALSRTVDWKTLFLRVHLLCDSIVYHVRGTYSVRSKSVVFNRRWYENPV